MGRVIVGVDPHKRSVTIEVVDEHGRVLSTGRFGTDTAGYRLMNRYVRDQWPHHVWAVEGTQGVGRPLAQRLLAQGEAVLEYRPSLLLGCGCSTRAMRVRPMRSTRMPLRWWRCAPRG